jgi:exopolysaccharide biosynthesis polyprenyl glycosylphosphotransferase
MNATQFLNYSSIGGLSVPRRIAILLLAGDGAVLAACLKCSVWLGTGQSLSPFDPIFYLFVALVLTGLYVADTYRPDEQIAGLRAPARIILTLLVTSGIWSFLLYLSRAWIDNPLLWRSGWIPGLIAFMLWAIPSRMFAVRWIRAHLDQSRWLVLGATERVTELFDDFQENQLLGKMVLLSSSSLVSSSSRVETVSKVSTLQATGAIANLSSWLSQPWTGVIVETEEKLSDDHLKQLMEVRLRGVPIYGLPSFYENFWYKLPPSLLRDEWFTFSMGFNLLLSTVSRKLKRISDVIISGLLLVVLAPLMAIVALAIRVDSPGPVFYSQIRTGLYCKTFRVYKFRSMYQDAEKRGAQWASERDPRITRVGGFLRLVRIDELPQIWNVLKGEMSLIGPRPERPEFDAKFAEQIPYYNVRYLVKPGITGWAQVLYPYGASLKDAYEKLSFDIYYIKNYSLMLDLAIVFKTFRVVLFGKGR